jgi:hypothetical protein
MKQIFLFLSLLIYAGAYSQGSLKEYTAVDEYVQSLGPLESFNVATIADTITRKFSDKEKKARAIYYWIANNISLDPKTFRSNDKKKDDPVAVTQSRKATPLGFAMLVQEMCSMANIRCLVVDGYTRRTYEDINNRPDAVNHSWNVVQLGKSPEEWQYVDAAKGSGYMDKKLTVFTKRFISNYFFTDKTLFNLDHFPDNSAWELGQGPKSLKEFYALPVISAEAYVMNLQKPNPATGYFKTNTRNTTRFTFKYEGSYTVKSVSVVQGEDNKKPKVDTVEFSDGGGEISFSIQFKKDDIYPVKLLVNGEELLQYMVEVTE